MTVDSIFTEPTIPSRIAAAEYTLMAYSTYKEGGMPPQDEPNEVVTDLLADLMHLADAQKLDFFALIVRARAHYQTEISYSLLTQVDAVKA